MHDLILHGWIAHFGDGLFAMRSLSALFGVLAIILMFPATREVLRLAAPPLDEGEIDMIAALSALICAVSLVTIKYSREARMYGLLLAAVLAQVWFLLRAIRRTALSDYVVLAILTAAMVATSLVSAPMLATEGLWLVVILASRARMKSAVAAGLAIAAGVAILTPALYVLIRHGAQAVREGKVNWLVMPPWWEPAAFFNKATGSVAFPVMAALAIWGLWRGWTGARAALGFALLWMWAPPVLLLIGSHVWRPMFVERYALYAFPAFFVLIAFGIWQLPGEAARAVAAAVVVALALSHIHSYWQKPHDSDWHEAARVATASLRPDGTVAVAPGWAVEVVRYYMIPAAREHAVRYFDATDATRVLVMSDSLMRGTGAAQLRSEYPHLLAHPRGVVVLAR
ncbi:MAG TPA: glycosyltransferase family 39 protein [Candidatus Binataceae bacterium]|nr:glycosyltransferase family 39 protein [Candidatus Binataceae bacterium]